MATQNNFKSTSICGIFTNSDYPDGSILAQGTFNRDLYVKGDLYLGKETGTIGAYIYICRHRSKYKVYYWRSCIYANARNFTNFNNFKFSKLSHSNICK